MNQRILRTNNQHPIAFLPKKSFVLNKNEWLITITNTVEEMFSLNTFQFLL